MFFLKDMRTEEQVFFERHKNRRACLILASNPHVLLSNYHAHFSYSN